MSLATAVVALTLTAGAARDIAQLAAEIDQDIANQPLPAPLPRPSILTGIAPPSEDFAERQPPTRTADRQLTTSTLVPPLPHQPKPLILPEPVAGSDLQVPFDLDMPEEARRDPFGAEPLRDALRPAEPTPAAEAPPVPVRATVPALAAADIARLRQAAQEFRRGNAPAGEALLAGTTHPTLKLAGEWLALRTLKQSAGFGRITRFVDENRGFPMAQWLRRRAEEALFIEPGTTERVLTFFEQAAPEMAGGKIALARALAARGEAKRAEALAREAFRDHKTNATLRTAILKDFPAAISAADQRYLAERLIYEGVTAEGLRVAASAGPQVLKVAQVLALSINESAALAAAIQKLDAPSLKQPAILFARTQMLRRTGKLLEAAEVLTSAPQDLDLIVDGDEWWTERRLVARKLLDLGEPQRAYDIVAAHRAESPAQVVDAEIHAGWIALRFLKQPTTASRHFGVARAAAKAPASVARAAYWLGRAAEASGDGMAEWHYIAASSHRHNFYGQLARDRTGRDEPAEAPHRPDNGALEKAAKSDALKVIRALIDAEALDFAQPLVIDMAMTEPAAESILVLGDLLMQYRQTRLTVVTAKLAMQRGLMLEEHAFPTSGIPAFEPTAASAEPAIVMSIARQESEFNPAAVSHAGARGLMQLMPATARRTAERNGMPFEVGRLTSDAAYNARIGAAHLGELFAEYGGNYILSFAAYNAGGRRVKEWTSAYGDPRDPGIDKVDWIERIPITETRHYVQKVLENLQVYRARLGGGRIAAITPDLQRGARPMRAPLLLKLAELPPVEAPSIR